MEATYGDVGRYWSWMLAVGVFFVALGIASLLMLPLVTTITAVIFGAFAVAAGVIQLYNGLTHTEGWTSRIANIILAILYIIFGALAFYNPMMAAAAITLAMAISFVLIGILRAYIAWSNREIFPHWKWAVVAGIISVILGALLIAGWPEVSAWFLGLYVAIDLLLNGWTMIGIALAAKELSS